MGAFTCLGDFHMCLLFSTLLVYSPSVEVTGLFISSSHLLSKQHYFAIEQRRSSYTLLVDRSDNTAI